MPVAPSFEDMLTVGEGEFSTRRPDLPLNEGDLTVAMLHAAAAMADGVIRYGTQAFKETYVDGAQGDALTTLVDDHFNIQRELASASQVSVEFSRTTGGAGGTIPAGTKIGSVQDASGTSVEFTTDAAIIVTAGANGPFTVNATASQTGRDGNVTAGTVTRVIQQPTFDPNWSVTNPAAGGGGNDAESDEDLRTRARLYNQTLRRGTLASLEYGALLVPTVRTAIAEEDASSGLVTVRVSDSDGNSTLQMVSDVILELDNWRAAGIQPSVVGGIRTVIDLGITVEAYRQGFSVDGALDVLISAVETRIEKLRVGETLYLDSVIAALISAFPNDIYDVTIDSIDKDSVSQTVGDLDALAYETFRPGTISIVDAG